MAVQDSIEREITIDAPLARVWELVAVPGWWVNDGEIIEHATTVDEDVTTLHWKGRDFPIRTVLSAPPNEIVFEWGSGESHVPDGERSIIEFALHVVDGGVRVVVKESGFAAYADSAHAERTVAENAQGWEDELAALAGLLAGGSSGSGSERAKASITRGFGVGAPGGFL